MSTESEATVDTPRIPGKRIWSVGIIAVIVAVIANIIWVLIAGLIFDLPTDFPPLEPGAIAIFTAAFSIIGVAVFWVIARLSQNPIRLFRIVAIIALLLSLIPDLAMLFNPSPGFENATMSAVLVLIVAHFIAAAIMIYALTTRTVD